VAASPSELRPRGAIGIMDAAVRLCSRSPDLWALTLPGGAGVAAAATWLAESLHTGRGVLAACGLMTAAWMLRALFQGAGSHFAERALVDPVAPTPRASLRVALAHAPTLVITAGLIIVVNLISLPLTLGFAVLFLSVHVAGYAVAMKDAGHPLALLPTCSRVLGPARTNTPGVRVALWGVVLLALNLHIAVNFAVLLGRKLLGLNLTFLDRYASLDNPVWVVAVGAVAFALMEPLRAAAAALLVVDGRVRQDGVDLQSAINRLPRRRGRTGGSAAAALLLAGLLCLVPGEAGAAETAAPAPSVATNRELGLRFQAVVDTCADGDEELTSQVERLALLRSRENASLSRFLSEVEGLASDGEDCEAAVQRLEAGLPLVTEAEELLGEGQQPDPGQKAQEILARPEFQEATPADRPEQAEVETPEAPEEEEEGWFSRFWKWLSQKLKEWFQREPVVRPTSSLSSGAGATFAWMIVGILGVAVIAVVLWLVLRASSGRTTGLEHLEVTAATPAGAEASEGALARAPQGWAELADALAAQGQHREAIRHLYLAVLAKLHALGAIDYDPGLSNWDYLRRFKGADGGRLDFKELTFRFDSAFYGREPVSAEAYARFRDKAARILAADSTRGQEASFA